MASNKKSEGRQKARLEPRGVAGGVRAHGVYLGEHLYGYGLYSNGVCSYGLYSYGLCSYGPI